MTPKQIVEALDKYIIGQKDAKMAVAVALRNRYRRSLLSDDIREDVTPRNIIMIGPTGVGKTEIARRLSKLVNAPFVKVEATKYTEVGYVGRDVESMVRDLVEDAVRLVTRMKEKEVEARATELAEERVLDLILPNLKQPERPFETSATSTNLPTLTTRDKYRTRLREGRLDNLPVEIEVEDSQPMNAIGIMGGMNDDIMSQMQDALESMMPKRRKKKQTTVANAVKILKEEEAKKLINMDDVTTLALEAAQRDGIIFIDEIDKIGSKGSGHGPDVSREGVQRDFLPIVEGTTVNTKYGVVKTDHILFIAAGAFHMTKVTDLIPELQGRFPIRVELSSLSENDFKQILTDPENALIKQETALLETEDVHLVFTDDAIAQIAHMAYMMNETMEEIGARRLHTVMETLLEEISFSADEHQGQTFTIDADYVKTRLEKVYKETNLNKYIL
ncbi:MAG: ATP-dependent protease ATPase subunit HslU [Clostridiales bacterium]|nr:ATP-dependent protease ATPase subunit HslU [Clostridiales bacterium]